MLPDFLQKAMKMIFFFLLSVIDLVVPALK